METHQTASSIDEGLPLKVIVVDDDASACTALAAAVRGLGHHCRCAYDGRSAKALHQEDPAQVILSDWMMPEMDGVTLCKYVRDASPQGQYTHFILVTAETDRERFLEAMAAGADDYIAKPVDLDELSARLRAACRVARAYAALRDANRELRRETLRCLEAARTDPLTQAANRLSLQSDLEAIVESARREGSCCCVAICDIDWFKSYNDSYGHLSGDNAIRLVSTAIRDQLREDDGFYRYGGEEFLVVLPGQTLADAAQCLERVRRAVAGLADVESSGALQRQVTISVGISELSLDASGDVISSWLHRADLALYRAKAGGRNRVEMDLPGTDVHGPRDSAVELRILAGARRSSRPPAREATSK